MIMYLVLTCSLKSWIWRVFFFWNKALTHSLFRNESIACSISWFIRYFSTIAFHSSCLPLIGRNLRQKLYSNKIETNDSLNINACNDMMHYSAHRTAWIRFRYKHHKIAVITRSWGLVNSLLTWYSSCELWNLGMDQWLD